MASNRVAARVAAATAIYFMFTICLMCLGTVREPRWLEDLTMAIAVPALLAIALWTPLLAPLGLTESGWIVMPSVLGASVVSLVYTALAYGITLVVLRMVRGESAGPS